eukprot:1340450-Prymnesium_polylepis.2
MTACSSSTSPWASQRALLHRCAAHTASSALCIPVPHTESTQATRVAQCCTSSAYSCRCSRGHTAANLGAGGPNRVWSKRSTSRTGVCVRCRRVPRVAPRAVALRRGRAITVGYQRRTAVDAEAFGPERLLQRVAHGEYKQWRRERRAVHGIDHLCGVSQRVPAHAKGSVKEGGCVGMC